MSGPPSNPHQGNNLANQGSQDMHAQLGELREEINQMRESNIRLFRATAREMEILRTENSNVTNILLSLKENFDFIVPNFLEQRDKIRELETWRINLENQQIPHRQRIVQHDEEFLQDQDEKDGNEEIHANDEQDNEQKQTNSKNEDKNSAPNTPKSIINEMDELAEHDVDVPAEMESIKVESVFLENELVAVNHSMFNDSSLKDTIQEEPEKFEGSSIEFDLAKTYCAVESLAVVEMASAVEEESAGKKLTETDSAAIDSEMEKEELTKEGSVEENRLTNKEAADQESIKVDGEEDMMDIVMTELEMTKGSSSEGMELANKESTLTISLTKDADSKSGESSTEINLAEKEFIDEHSSETDVTETDTNREDLVEKASPSQQKLIASKGENKAAGKEPATDIVSNMEESISRPVDFIKQESMDSNLTPRDYMVEVSTSNHAEEVENATADISVQETTTAMENSTAVSLNEKDPAEQDSRITNNTDRISSGPLQTSSSSSVSSQKTTMASDNSKSKRKFKNPVVLIKKRQKISLKSL